MPGLSRRRDTDSRNGRFESEMLANDMSDGTALKAAHKYQCSQCGKAFMERSLNCPRCDKKTMGELKLIPEQYRMRAREGAIRRARAKIGL